VDILFVSFAFKSYDPQRVALFAAYCFHLWEKQALDYRSHKHQPHFGGTEHWMTRLCSRGLPRQTLGRGPMVLLTLHPQGAPLVVMKQRAF
jgi:hypothetical protein